MFSVSRPQYTMGLRTIDLDVTAATSGRAVPMASANASSGTTSTMWSAKSYVSGSGNLCVNCHQDRRTLTTRNAYFLPVTVSTTSISLSSKLVKLNAAGSQALVPGGTPHHGPQGDFLMGLDSASVTTIPGYTGISSGYTPTYTWSSASPTPFTLSPHYTNTSTNIAGYNSCVTCHVELGDHSMYLTNLSSTPNDKLSVCVACHAVGATAATVNLPLGSNKTMVASPTSFSNAIANSTLLSDIQEAKRVLLNYFLDATKFYSATRLLNDGTTNYSTYTSTPDGTINTTSTKAGYSTTGLMGYVGTDLTGPTISSPLGSSVAVPVPDDNDGKTYWLLADAIAASNTLNKDGTIKIAASVAASGSGADYGVVASPTQDALGNQVALAAPFSAGASIVWNKDWSTSTANLYLTAAQAQAYYNFMLFNEDRSEGVHNPKYAAQLLYDAIHLIPALSQPTNWSSRP